MHRESQQICRFPSSPDGTYWAAPGLTVFALDCVNPVNLAPWLAVSRQGQGGANQVPQTQMRAGIAAGPHCRRCWHSGFPAPELTASFRRSLPFGSHPSGGTPPVRSAFRSFLQGRRFLLAQPSVLRRPQFLTTWAWQSLVPVPQSARCRASCRCERVSLSRPSDDAPSGPALRPRLRTYSLRGGKGPSALVWRAAPRSASAGRCPRSSDHRPCRFRFTSGRHSGIRNRSFRPAIRPFQSAPQHAGTGFNAYVPVRPDWSASAC